MTAKKKPDRKPAKPPKAIDKNLPVLEVDLIEDNIPIAKIIDLRNRKLTYLEIARILGCSEQNVHQRLQPFRQSIDHLQAVKDTQADTLAVISDSILSSLNSKDIQKSSAYQKVGMYGVLFDKERLARDKSTSNVHHYHDFSKNMTDLDKEILALGSELGEDVIDAEFEEVDGNEID